MFFPPGQQKGAARGDAGVEGQRSFDWTRLTDPMSSDGCRPSHVRSHTVPRMAREPWGLTWLSWGGVA